MCIVSVGICGMTKFLNFMSKNNKMASCAPTAVHQCMACDAAAA